jgi:hypothetical protein
MKSGRYRVNLDIVNLEGGVFGKLLAGMHIPEPIL